MITDQRTRQVIILDEVERMAILHALDAFNGNRTKAAGALGISIRTMRNKLNIYREAGIKIPERRAGFVANPSEEGSVPGS